MLDENDEKSDEEINYNKKSHVKKQLKKGKALDERTPTTASKKQSEPKKDLLKTSSRKAKKKLIGELTFIEPHLDTFYIGLNDGWKNHLVNPMQAKVLGVENANDLAKNWVNPDTNLLRSRKKSKIPVSNSTHNNRTTKADNRKYCPLEFVETEENNQIAEINEDEHEVEKQSLLKKVANDMDKTDFICPNKTPLKSARILANDTPVEYYGISMIERRKLGI